MASEGFHPEKSRVSDNALADFLRAPITGDLLEVPGIGEASAKALREAGISTTFALIGKYLTLKEEGVGPVEHADRFYFWLKSIGTAAGHRAGVVHCIAEKMNITFVGIYDSESYGTFMDPAFRAHLVENIRLSDAQIEELNVRPDWMSLAIDTYVTFMFLREGKRAYEPQNDELVAMAYAQPKQTQPRPAQLHSGSKIKAA